MKQITNLMPILLLMASCTTHEAKTTAEAPMDEDFEPCDPHPFACRTDQTSGLQLTAESYNHGDTLGTLVISLPTDEQPDNLLHNFTFCDAEVGAGSAVCTYNDFFEITDLWVETADVRSHSTLQWDDNGNLTSLSQETWTAENDSTLHSVQIFEYRYSEHTAYGNWYAGQAEQIGGPLAPALHAGRMGRAPWTLPESYTCVISELSHNMVSQQETQRGRFEYTHDNNGRVIRERQLLPQQERIYEYTYKQQH